MFHALTGAGYLPAVIVLALLVPVAVHALTGPASPFREDPLDTYARWWRHLTDRRRP